ncbi:helix-turn-helix domain-containing protein [Pseudomonas citronellolis]|uniref:helix-turn-helix domain-containing protein n=1 Tax=Pseudomonas citronellolis TaxID=53408 RepID=UPI0010659B97|nr:helix-turn-helix transcriptional regulator [Pseudomonas humi]
MNSFGDRLRLERERLGLSQEALGEIGGVKKLAQINYEKGKRHPDSEYLAAIAGAGVDVLYLLTGQRSSGQSIAVASPHLAEAANPVAEGPPLNRREQALLANYRGSDEEGRRAVESTASALAHRDSAKKDRKGGQ